MGGKFMKKLFIDTNIFLDFYRSNTEKLKVLDELKKNAAHIVFPRQVYNEYKRNRVLMLENILSSIKNSAPKTGFSSSVISDFDEYKEMNRLIKEHGEKSKELQNKIKEMIEEPQKDLVFVKVEEIINLEGVTILEVTDSHIEKARKRQLLGNPPGSEKFCIGDEIIWECILSGVEDDIVIVSRDNTYVKNSYIIKEEFKDKTGKELLGITDKITDALKTIGETPDEDITKIEKQQMSDMAFEVTIKLPYNDKFGAEPCLPHGWDIVSEKGTVGPLVASNGIISGITGSHSSYICPTCGFNGPWNGVICLSCGNRSMPD